MRLISTVITLTGLLAYSQAQPIAASSMHVSSAPAALSAYQMPVAASSSMAIHAAAPSSASFAKQSNQAPSSLPISNMASAPSQQVASAPMASPAVVDKPVYAGNLPPLAIPVVIDEDKELFLDDDSLFIGDDDSFWMDDQYYYVEH